jgi:hypothetical protein
VRDEDEQRFLTRPKANYLRDSEKRKALAFDTVEGAPDIPVVRWAKEPVEIDIEDMLSGKRDSQLSRAVTFLEGLFINKERAEVITKGSESFDAVLKTTVSEEAASAGISEGTLRRAMKAVGIESKRLSEKGGRRGEGEWYWTKKRKPSEAPEIARS